VQGRGSISDYRDGTEQIRRIADQFKSENRKLKSTNEQLQRELAEARSLIHRLEEANRIRQEINQRLEAEINKLRGIFGAITNEIEQLGADINSIGDIIKTIRGRGIVIKEGSLKTEDS
jgi:predicted nuclease with TOPRIM domain